MKLIQILFIWLLSISLCHAQSIDVSPPGRGQVPGTVTNDNACTGCVGEYVTSDIPNASAVSLTTGTAANITSISLTAGDWDVSGVIYYKTAATTNYTTLGSYISLVSATTDSLLGRFGRITTAGTVPGAATNSVNVLPRRISISSTTTVYLVTLSSFTVSTLDAYGNLSARRVR